MYWSHYLSLDFIHVFDEVGVMEDQNALRILWKIIVPGEREITRCEVPCNNKHMRKFSHTSVPLIHPSNIKHDPPPPPSIGLWPIHLNDLDRTESWSLKVDFGVTITKKGNPLVVYFFHSFHERRMRGTLVCDNSFTPSPIEC